METEELKTISAADLFCGAGGTSTGFATACEDLGLRPDLLAVNHWPIAVETHQHNHPWARHLCKALHEIDPRGAVPSGKLDVLVASPECTHHSIARGGRPMSDQMRASGWQVVDWLSKLHVDNLLIENVREFRDWGPLGVNGRPIKRRRGETYRAFLSAIRSLGYAVEDRVLNAADYGDATTRERLFVIARRGHRKVKWPDMSHSQGGMLGKRWRPARDVIDWEIPGESIFERKRQLSENTMRRIAAGLKKFGGIELGLKGTTKGLRVQPFILPHRQFDGMQVDSIERPLRSITAANGNCNGLVQPFIVPFFGERAGQDPRTHSVDEPLPAVTSHGAGGLVSPYLIEPFLVQYYGTGGAKSVRDPLPTITTKDRFGLVMVNGRPMALDIRFRMLTPRELATGMGFPTTYEFKGTKADQVRQIGNAVAVNTARALCFSVLADYAAAVA